MLRVAPEETGPFLIWVTYVYYFNRQKGVKTMPIQTTKSPSKLAAIRSTKDNPPEIFPDLPATLPIMMEPIWQDIIRHMRGLNMWVPEKSSVLEQYLLNLHTVRQAYERMQADGGPITLDGKPHPSSQIIGRHTATSLKCCLLLGLGKETFNEVESAVTSDVKSNVWG